MTEELLRKQLADIPKEDLIEVCQNQLIELCKTGGRSITMSVPPSKSDTDMVLFELLRRFKESN